MHTFKGGVHPPDSKINTKSMKIEELSASQKLYFPVSQHIGAPAEPVVWVGDKVYVGQLIAKATSFVSANIHSSVSGTIVAIEPSLTPSGAKIQSIIIENDGEYNIHKDIAPNKPLSELTPKEIVDVVRKSGIVGMGGAAFPTHVKLSPPEDKPIEYVVINGAECEPFLTSDHRVMLEEPELVIEGCMAIMKAVGAKKGYIAIESNKVDAIEVMKSYNKEQNIAVLPLETKYPQGSEKQLIFAVTGREVPNGKLPSDVGVVVNNIDTCGAIARAIKTGMPLIQRVVTVSGSAISQNKNYRVRIGTPILDIINHAGGFKEQPERLILGGPMMGQAIFNLNVPAIKSTGAVLALTKADLGDNPESVCIRCGKCVEQCPMNLQPLYLNIYAQKNDFDKLEKLNIFDCMECGACSYLCPGRQSPVQNVRVAKQMILQKRKEK